MPRGKNKAWVLQQILPTIQHYEEWLETNKSSYAKKKNESNKNGVTVHVYKCLEHNCPFQYRIVLPLNTEEVEFYSFDSHVHQPIRSVVPNLRTRNDQAKFPKAVKDIIDPLIFRGKI